IRASHVLQKMSPEDDVEAYLLSFERCAEREGWPKELWAGIVAPFLISDAQKAYFDLEPGEASNYIQLKVEILARAGVTPTVRAQGFHTWTYCPRSQMFNLVHLAQRWLQPDVNTSARVELLVMDHYLRALPPRICKWVGLGNPSNAQDLIALVERQISAEELLRSPAVLGQRGAKEWSTSAKGQLGVGGGKKGNGNKVVTDHVGGSNVCRVYCCFHCQELGHVAAQCPNQEEPMQTNLREPGNACVEYSSWITQLPMKVNGKEVMALADSGSAVILVSSALIGSIKQDFAHKTGVKCVHRDVFYYPTSQIQVEMMGQTWKIKAGVVLKLPHLIILGRDFPG
uniref:CCHC-type domain-containing protein n=1 Tax=Latimeria chalumnae TaxID=7897 RepID=H2ZY33_LATCH